MPKDDPTINGVPIETVAQMVWAGYSESDIIAAHPVLDHAAIVLACYRAAKQTSGLWRKRWASWIKDNVGDWMEFGDFSYRLSLPPSSKEATPNA